MEEEYGWVAGHDQSGVSNSLQYSPSLDYQVLTADLFMFVAFSRQQYTCHSSERSVRLHA
jgi:hypothetical protein